MLTKLGVYIKKRDLWLFLLAGATLVGLGFFTFQQTQYLIDIASSIPHSDPEIHNSDGLLDRLLRLRNGLFSATILLSVILSSLIYFLNRELRTRKKIEQLLQTAANEVSDLYNHAPCGYHSIDTDGLIINMNQTELKWLGYTAPEVIGRLKITDLLTENSRAIVAENFPIFKTRGIVNNLELEFIRKDGSILSTLVNATIVVDTDGKFLKTRSVVFDNTERNKNEAWLKTLLEALPDALVIANEAGKIVTANAQSELNFGYKKEELIGQPIEILLPERLRDRHTGHRLSFFQNPVARSVGDGMELNAVRKNGSEFPAEVKLSPLHSPNGILVTASIRDISDRKQLDDKVRFLATIAENIQDPVIATDDQLRIINWNKAAEKVFGWNQDEVLGSIATEILKVGDWVGDREQSIVDFNTKGFWQGELSCRTRSGEWLHLLVTLSKLKGGQGENIGALAVVRDITQQRRNEAKIAFMARMVDNTNEGMYSVTNDFKVLTWNKGAEEIYGFKAEEVIGRSVYDFIRSTLTVEQRTKIREKIKSSEKWQDELEHFTKEGKLIHILASTSAIKNASGETIGFVSIARDITERKETEKQLEFLATITRSIEDVMMVTDRNFNITRWNARAESLLGWSAEEMIGKPASFLRVKNLTPNHESVLPILAEKGYWHGESIVVSKTDVPIHFMSTYSIIRDAKNQTSGYLILARDITAENISQDRIRKLALLVESTSEAVISVSERFRINTWNKGAENLFGYTYDEVRGERLVTVLKADLTQQERASFRQQVMEKGFVTDSRYFKNRNDKVIFCSISIKAMKGENAGTEGYAVVINDLTKIKQAEQELIQALQQEKDLVEMKSRFVSIASHEFRTPLATISLASGFLRKHNQKLTPAQLDEKFTNIDRQIYQMTQLLDDVLVIGKSEAGKLSPVYSQISGDVIERLGREALNGHRNSHILNIRENNRVPFFVSDEKLLRNIIFNLINNAAKFSPESSEVFMDIDWRSSAVVITVEDRGIGIPADDLKNLFTSFSRGSNVGAIEGTGLGLAIVKKAVELLHGTIDVTSTENVGTRFTVTLPLTGPNG